VSVPEGYLGAEARITAGPAPELVAAGYALETADAPLLHAGLGLADLAHVVELVDAGVAARTDVAPLLAALLDLLAQDPAEVGYDPVYGDVYNSRERLLESRLGAAAGWLHVGRTRREAGRIAFRLALRDGLLDLHEAVRSFAGSLLDRAAEHAGTVWADLTYLQPAQPSSFGHYLGSFAEEAVRTLERVELAYAAADVSPAGVGGTGGSRLPLDRVRLAAALGFGAVGAHARDVMWAVDGLADAAGAAVQAGLTADRVAEDLEVFASPAFGYVTLSASVCRASVLLPQKRNPYALAVIRGGAGTLVGRLTGLLTTSRTPSARTDSWLYGYGEVAGTVALAARLVRLAAVVVGTLTVDAGRLAAAAGADFTGSADLAEELVVRHRIDYRSAYRIVGRAVADAYAAGAPTLAAAGLAAAARTVAGLDLAPDPGLLAAVQDPVAVVATRTSVGGAAPERVRERVAELRPRLAAGAGWRSARRAAAAASRDRLLDRARTLAGGAPAERGDS
jgi:argininosuccinate lyase